PLPGRRHGRPARGGPERGRRPALPLARSAVAGGDGRAPAHRRPAARPAGGGGVRARPDLRLGRRGHPGRGGLPRRHARTSDRAARRPLLIAPSISAKNSPAVCSPAKASGPVGSRVAASTSGGGDVEYAAPTHGSSDQVERVAP